MSSTRTFTRTPLVAMRRVAAGIAIGLAALVAVPVETGGALVTGDSVVYGNRFSSEPAADATYGIFKPVARPFAGTSFSTNARGFIGFDLWDTTKNPWPPEPYPDMKAGDSFVVRFDVPASLRLDSKGFSTADPSRLNACHPDTWTGTGPKLFMTAACDETATSSGTRVDLKFTAVRAWTSSTPWNYLGKLNIGVMGASGITAGTGTAHTTLEFPDDAGTSRPRTAEIPFATIAGEASTLGVYAPSIYTNAGSDEWDYGDQGVLRWSTGLQGPGSRGLTIKTGETFTYQIDLPNSLAWQNGTLARDTSPDPAYPVEDVCEQVVPGYTISCGMYQGYLDVSVKRTGPDVVDDRPFGGDVAVPLRSEYVGPARYGGVSTMVLVASMEQLGSGNLRAATNWTALRPSPTEGLGIYNAAVTPYVGSVFAEDGTGRITANFFPDADAIPAGTYLKAGDQLTVTAELPSTLEIDPDRVYDEQGDPQRNWCDSASNNWGPALTGYLADPSCTPDVDPTTGDTTVALSATATRDIPNQALADGFLLRVNGWHDLANASDDVTLSVAITGTGTVLPKARTTTASYTTMEGPSSTLGLWQPQIKPDTGAELWPLSGEGAIRWWSEPATPEPFRAVTGDTITYTIDLPTLPTGGSIEYQQFPTGSAENICASGAGDFGDGWEYTCDITGQRIVVTLTRTGPDTDDARINGGAPFSISVINNRNGTTVETTATITMDTTIAQSGSDQRAKTIPLHINGG